MKNQQYLWDLRKTFITPCIWFLVWTENSLNTDFFYILRGQIFIIRIGAENVLLYAIFCSLRFPYILFVVSATHWFLL